MSADSAATPQTGLWAGWLRLASLGSLGLATLYGLGFLVHLGHSYLLGFFPGVLTPLDALRFAGEFLFQCFQALAYSVFQPTRAPWPGKVGLGLYLASALVLLSLDGLLATSRVQLWQRSRPKRRRLRHTARVVITAGLTVFTLCWLAKLTLPFVYHDLLFPMRGLQEYEQRFAKYSTGLTTFDLVGGADEKQRRDRQKALLRSALLDEFDAALERGDTGPHYRLQDFADWMRRSPAEKNSTLGVLLLTSAASIVLLIRTGLRQSPGQSVQRSAFRRLWRSTVRVLLALAIFSQAITIPFDFGILLVERQVPRARVRADGFEGLERRELLLLGQDDSYHYFYSPFDFWTVHVIPKASVQEMRLVGKVPVLFWMNELIPEA